LRFWHDHDSPVAMFLLVVPGGEGEARENPISRRVVHAPEFC
jgi:hypothetical protein